jgi:phage-related protein
MENAKAAIGTALLPVLQRILGPLQSMAGFLEDNATWLVPVVGAILALVAAYKLLVMIQTAVNAVMALFGVTSAIALGPLLLIILGIAALVAAVILLWKNWDTVWNAIVTAFDAVKNALVAAWQWVADMFSSIWEGIKGAFSSALDFVRGIIDSIRGFFEGIISWLATNWPTILAILTGPFGIAVLLIVNNWQRIVDFFTGLPGLISRLVGGIGDIIKAPFQWAADQVSNIVEGIKSTFSGAVDAVKNLWNTFARGWNAIEIEVPSVHIPWPIDKDVGGFTLGVPDLPTFAKGGIVTRPTLAMIGEAGPEAVIPLGGRNSALVVNVNITTTGLGADSPAIQRAVVAALRGYVGRNGPLELGA